MQEESNPGVLPLQRGQAARLQAGPGRPRVKFPPEPYTENPLMMMDQVGVTGTSPLPEEGIGPA